MAEAMDVDSAPNDNTARIQINLSTRDTSLSIPVQPLRVSTNLKRYGLSTLVNHLLDTPKPIPFDFLIDGTYLRSSIDEYLTQAGLSSEKPLDIEYVRSQLPPTYIGSFEQDDWISSVHLSPSSSSSSSSPSPTILTGSFNGSAQITSLSGDILARTVPMHTQSVKAVTWVSSSSFLTAGLDRTINLWSYTPEAESSSETREILPTTTYISHKSTITSLSHSPPTNQFLSSSSDHTIAVWSTNPSLLPTVTLPQSTAFTRKRRRLSSKPPNTIKKGPLAVLTAHTAPVSQVTLHPTDQTAAYSASWDKSIITHDLITSQPVSTRTTQHPLLSITALSRLNLLAAGSAARHITLHDPREDSRVVQTAVLRGHTNGVVSIVGSPESEFIFASGSHDGTVRVWDVRSVSSNNATTTDDGDNREGRSLFVIKRESGIGKVFGIDWSRDMGLVGVGEDKKIQINRGEGMADVTVVDQS